MKRSEVVTALANLASQGTYQVQPQQAREINAIFEHVATLINELEAEESASVSTVIPVRPLETEEENNNE